MPTPTYLYGLDRLDDIVRRPGPRGAYDRAVVYAEGAGGWTDADVVEALVYGDSATFERADRSFFEVRPADGGGQMVRSERPTLSALVTRPRDRAVAERWGRDRTPLRALLMGTAWSDHVVWDRPARPTVVETDGSGVSGLALTLAEIAPGSDGPHDSAGAVRRSPDLLAGVLDGLVLGGLTEDPDRPASGLARGLLATAGAAASVAAGEQRAAPADGVTASLEHIRPLPLGSSLWTVAEAVVSGPAGAALSGYDPGDVAVSLEALDGAGVVLAASTLPVLAAGGPEVAGVALRLPGGTRAARHSLARRGQTARSLGRPDKESGSRPSSRASCPGVW